MPTTEKATGKVDKDFIEVICDPIIAPKKTVIVAAVNPKIDFNNQYNGRRLS